MTADVDTSAPRSESDADGRQHNVDREQRDDAQHQGLVDGGAHTFGATGHRQAAITADEPGDQAEGAALTMEVTTSGRPVISVSVDT
ncbi:hypothetical protein GCM10009645_05850 [Mycolicibacterium poriferae]|uniref:Uncharacterized protein n=1 Tax=Mycolicibacterium poriferae TaxID=39694 RepID=A0A6N4V7B7_9MYCO|nr:hypothetical protein MPOR_07030 [Mycolicibacterium poriferae]